MKKFWYGVLAFAPIVLLIICLASIILPIIAFFILGIGMGVSGSEVEGVMGLIVTLLILLMYAGFFIGCFGTVIITWVDIIVFIIDAIKNPKVDQNMKAVWCCLFIFAQTFVFPVYWWIYIKKS